MSRSIGELDFIKEYTRSLLVPWAAACVQHGQLPTTALSQGVYLECALENGWLTKSEPRRLTAKGFKAASAFLRR
mgnify:CR=1 FL=1